LNNLKDIRKPKIKTEIPGPKAKELLKIKEECVPQGVFNTVPTFIKRGEGAVVEDIDGNIFLDFAAGIAVLNIGYSHPEVVKAVKEQADKFFHSSINVILKIARKYTKRTDIICFEGAFHGRTLLTMSLTSKVKPYSFGFGPFAPGIHKIPYANCYRCAYGLERETCNLRCAERLEEIFTSVVDSENVAAIILEPIQGESGFIIPPNEFITKIKNICDRYNILLIADEIQTGFCRTGKMFACEYWSVIPDIITMAKSLSAGIPLSAVTGRKEIMQSAHVAGIGGTYSGNPLACSAGLKVIDIMKRDNFASKASKIGAIIYKRLEKMQNKYSLIGDVRGRGAMVAFELVKNRKTKTPAKEETNALIKEAYKQGLILLSAGLYSNVVRLLVPLVIRYH